MSVSVFEHPWLSGLFADQELQALFSAEAQLAHMLSFERALTSALGATGQITAQEAQAASAAFDSFEPDWSLLGAGTGRDGVVVPNFVKALRELLPAPKAVHTGATSQDVIDTALALTIARVSKVIDGRLESLSDALEALSERFGAREMLARTRMQTALPMPVSHRIESWSAPLQRARAQLGDTTQHAAVLSLGGPVGTGGSFGPTYLEIAEHMSKALELPLPERARHSERDCIVSYGDLMSRVSGSLGKMGQDISLMVQQGVGEVKLSGGGMSSAMAHKQNPVLAELLVTLGRFNAAQTAAMHMALVHEQERSGSAWALEWMVLPQMIVTTGRGLNAAHELVDQIAEIAP